MPIEYQGVTYRSKKHPVLEWVFRQLTSQATAGMGANHSFTLGDIARGYQACSIPRPASISNTILDLTRKDRGIESRLPPWIIALRYDLRKKTGPAPNGENYAGEFVHVGVAGRLRSWLVWPTRPHAEVEVRNRVPDKVAPLLSKDEGALFSVIDYCDALSWAMYEQPDRVLRVQAPMKWQPNEIDALYLSDFGAGPTLYPVEAKALTTGDDINLEQMLGAYQTLRARYESFDIVPVAIRMGPSEMRVGVLALVQGALKLSRYIHVTFHPPIAAWLS